MVKYQVEAVKNGIVMMNATATNEELPVLFSQMTKLITDEEMKDSNVTFSINAKPFI